MRLGDDGTVLVPSVRDCRSVLTLTEPKRPEELRERLRTYLNRPTSAIDPARSDDPVALGTLRLDRERARTEAGRPARPRARRHSH